MARKTILPVAAALLGLTGLASAALAAPPSQIRIACGNPGTPWCVMGTAMAQVFAQEGVRANTELGGGLSNVVTVSQGKQETGFTMTAVVPMAQAGEKPFPTKIDNIAGLANISTNLTHILVHADSGVKTVADLKGKAFATQPVGNVTTLAFELVLQAYGLDPEKDLQLTRGGQNFGANQMKDRKVVGFTATTGYPAAAFVEATTTLDARFLSISDEAFAKIKSMNPGFNRAKIPADVYRGQSEPVPTMSTPAVLIVRKDMPVDQVYWIAKTLVEHIDEIKKAHNAARDLSLETIAQVPALELHPGAAKAYKEAGARM